jgi:hypothetical protein
MSYSLTVKRLGDIVERLDWTRNGSHFTPQLTNWRAFRTLLIAAYVWQDLHAQAAGALALMRQSWQKRAA